MIGARFIVDGEYTEAGLIAIGILAVCALVAAWLVSYLLARRFRVGRAGAVTCVSLAITTGAAIITAAIAAVAAAGAVIFGVMVTWSGMLYQPSIVVAVIVAIVLPTLLAVLVTPALARVMNAERVEHVAAASALDASSADLPAIRI